MTILLLLAEMTHSVWVVSDALAETGRSMGIMAGQGAVRATLASSGD